MCMPMLPRSERERARSVMRTTAALGARVGIVEIVGISTSAGRLGIQRLVSFVALAAPLALRGVAGIVRLVALAGIVALGAQGVLDARPARADPPTAESSKLDSPMTDSAKLDSPALERPGRSPGLGVIVDHARIAAIDLTIMPDGEGLPAGSGTARAGEKLYREHCLVCHGPEGKGGPNDRLAGGRGSLATTRPLKTIGSYWPHAPTVFDYVRRAMPYPSPGSLDDAEVYALTAYLLHLNGLVGPDDVLDAEALPAIEMPNADGFDPADVTRP